MIPKKSAGIKKFYQTALFSPVNGHLAWLPSCPPPIPNYFSPPPFPLSPFPFYLSFPFHSFLAISVHRFLFWSYISLLFHPFFQFIYFPTFDNVIPPSSILFSRYIQFFLRITLFFLFFFFYSCIPFNPTSRRFPPNYRFRIIIMILSMKSRRERKRER